jgi:hypothetical protein
VIAFLTANGDMAIAKLFEIIRRKLIIRTFCLLEAQNIGTGFFQKPLNQA